MREQYESCLLEKSVTCGDEQHNPDSILRLLKERGYERTYNDVMECDVYSRPLDLRPTFVPRHIEVRDYRKKLPCPLFEACVTFEAMDGLWIQHKMYGLSYGELYERLPELERDAANVVTWLGKRKSSEDE